MKYLLKKYGILNKGDVANKVGSGCGTLIGGVWSANQTGIVITSKCYGFYKAHKLHREDGPACVSKGEMDWFLNGMPKTEEQVLQYAIAKGNKRAVKNILWKKYLDEEWDF